MEWLHEHNSLYRDIVIDYEELNTWSDQVIPTSIMENTVFCESDHLEKEGYAMDLETENHEDGFQAAITKAGLDDANSLNGCVYVDANNTRENPISQLMFAQGEKKPPRIWKILFPLLGEGEQEEASLWI